MQNKSKIGESPYTNKSRTPNLLNPIEERVSRSMKNLNPKKAINIQPNAHIINRKRALNIGNVTKSNAYTSESSVTKYGSNSKTLLEDKSVRAYSTNDYGRKMNSRVKNILSNVPSSKSTRNKVDRYHGSNSIGQRKYSQQPKTMLDPMTRNYKNLVKMNNTTAPSTKNDPDKNFILRNVFTDYTAGCNLSDYENLLHNPKVGNGTVQWIIKLRQRFEDARNDDRDRPATFSTASVKSRYSGLGKAPSCYYSGKYANFVPVF